MAQIFSYILIFPAVAPLLGIFSHAMPQRLAGAMGIFDFGKPSIWLLASSVPAVVYGLLKIQNQWSRLAAGRFGTFIGWSVLSGNCVIGGQIISSELEKTPFEASAFVLGFGGLMISLSVWIFFKVLGGQLR